MAFRDFFKSRLVQLTVAFVCGGVLTGLFLPEIIRKEKTTETKVVDKTTDKTKDSNKTMVKLVRRVRYKITYPDGRIIESEIYESNTEQIARIRTELEEKLKIAESKIKIIETHTNPKRFNIAVGVAPRFFNSKIVYTVATSYNLWGPLTIGITVISNGTIAPTLGFTF